MDHKKCAKTQVMAEKKCDYIFIGDKDDAGWVAPLELKGGRLDATEVVEQIQAGASVADHIVPREAQTRFRPIVVHGRGIHRAELKLLQKRRVRFRNQNSLIGKVRCGTSLVGALKKA